MAKKKYIDYKKMQAELFKRTEGYAATVRIIYQQVFERIINLVKGTELEDGKPFSCADYGYSAVSYTHLDVYKRQERHRAVYRRFFGTPGYKYNAAKEK